MKPLLLLWRFLARMPLPRDFNGLRMGETSNKEKPRPAKGICEKASEASRVLSVSVLRGLAFSLARNGTRPEIEMLNVSFACGRPPVQCHPSWSFEVEARNLATFHSPCPRLQSEMPSRWFVDRHSRPSPLSLLWFHVTVFYTKTSVRGKSPTHAQPRPSSRRARRSSLHFFSSCGPLDDGSGGEKKKGGGERMAASDLYPFRTGAATLPSTNTWKG